MKIENIIIGHGITMVYNIYVICYVPVKKRIISFLYYLQSF